MSRIVFDAQISTAATKVLEANLNVFNTASRGAIVAGAGDFLGDYLERVMWAAQQMVSRRNAYGSGKVSATELQQILERAVKVDQRIGPLKVTGAIMDRLGKNNQEAAAVMGTQVAQQLIQDQIDVVVGTLLAATPAELTYDFSSIATGIPNLKQIAKSLRLMGDAYQRIVVQIMSGASYNDMIVEGNMGNMEKLFTIDNLMIMQSPLGQTFLVTDAMGLDTIEGTGADAKSKQRVLSLQAGAAVVQTNPMVMRTQDILGEENLATLIQGETHFNLGLKGYAYVGKANALGTGDKPTSPTPATEQTNNTTAITANPGEDGTSTSSGSASPVNATLFAKTSWKVADPRWKPTTGKPLTGGTLDAAKGLAGVVAVFGDK